MKERYKYRLWRIIESFGWTIIPIPASGGGRKGEHRPDIIIGNGKRRIVAEVKNCMIPMYLSYESDVEPVLRFAKAFDAIPLIIAKKKNGKKWKCFYVEDLKKSSGKSLLIDKSVWGKGTPLENLLRMEFPLEC
ncbi:MAG: hypothetical protein ACTSVF_00270 [Candidatus Asgardarchaeia archaeon]